METSLMQHLRPDWVLPLEEAGAGREHKFKMQALREGWVWTQRDWLQATDDTGIGDPQYSTAAKGQRCLEDVASKIASFLLELAAADLNDLYEA
jgi:creatinine amidohydrolase